MTDKEENSAALNALAQATNNRVVGGIYHRPFGDWAKEEEQLEAEVEGLKSNDAV